MIDIAIGFSSENNSLLAAEEAVGQAKTRLKSRSKIDLGLVFHSFDLSAPTIAKTLSEHLEDIPLIGAAGAALMCDRGVYKHGLTVMLLGFPEGVYCSTAVARNIHEKNPFLGGKELAEHLLYGFKNIQRNFGFLLFDRLVEEATSFVSGLQEHLGRGFPCFGTSASSYADVSKASLYYNSEVLTDGCVGIRGGGKVSFGLGLQHGWRPIGKPHLVTSSVGNIVSAVDGKPALGLYEDYLGLSGSRLTRELRKLSASYPIGLLIPGEQEYLLRNVISVDERGALFCQGNIPEGATVRLMISTKETCLEAASRALAEAKENLANAMPKIAKVMPSRFAIVFSSFSRYNLLRRDIKEELSLIKKSLPGIPIIGLFTQGELAPLNAGAYHGQIYFHNQDFSVLIIEG
ncbi:MAG: FIST N-terminal domain-containing protein [Candidatus Omnitrophica bacterium]|nr:FIST N-terminal domain-containing protein [Candidatus Omnitrophota bacterium]